MDRGPRFPLEIFGLIIDYGAEYDTDEVWEPRWRSRFLLTLSLVNKGISAEARKHLWAVLSIEREVTLKKIIDSPALGLHQKHTVELNADLGCKWQDALRLIETVVGLKRLKITNFGMWNNSAVVTRNFFTTTPSLVGLQDLQKLSVLQMSDLDLEAENPSQLEDRETVAWGLPFSLTTLRVSYVDKDLPNFFTFFNNSPPTIQHLTVHLSDHLSPQSEKDLAIMLKAVGPSLQTFDFVRPINKLLIPSFTYCTQLLHLFINCTDIELVTITSLIPSRLETLHLAPEFVLETTFTTINSTLESPCLRELKTFEFASSIPTHNLLMIKGFRELFQKMEARGIGVGLACTDEEGSEDYFGTDDEAEHLSVEDLSRLTDRLARAGGYEGES